MRPDLNAHSNEIPAAKTRRETRGLSALAKVVLFVLVIAGVGTVLTFGSLMEAVAGSYSDRVEPMAFEAETWLTTPAEDSSASVRLRMIDDLLQSGHLERGMHESLVLGVLGYPDDPAYDACATRAEHWCYYLGTTLAGTQEGGNFAHGAWLTIRFNDRNELLAWDVVD